jgi:hypothetical protein
MLEHHSKVVEVYFYSKPCRPHTLAAKSNGDGYKHGPPHAWVLVPPHWQGGQLAGVVRHPLTRVW